MYVQFILFPCAFVKTVSGCDGGFISLIVVIVCVVVKCLVIWSQKQQKHLLSLYDII